MLELLLVESPRDPCWELPRVTGAVPAGLLGWRSQPEVPADAGIDAGVPAPVAAIIADALCRAALVTFLGRVARNVRLTAEWQSVDTAWVRRVVSGRLLGRAGEFPLVCTRSPTIAAQLFDQDPFPWHLLGQAALLSELDRPPPDVDATLLRAIFAGRIEPRDFAASGVDGLLLPAVDGDFAGLFAFTDVRWTAALQGLETAARAAGAGWRRLGEPELKLAFLR